MSDKTTPEKKPVLEFNIRRAEITVSEQEYLNVMIGVDTKAAIARRKMEALATQIESANSLLQDAVKYIGKEYELQERVKALEKDVFILDEANSKAHGEIARLKDELSKGGLAYIAMKKEMLKARRALANKYYREAQKKKNPPTPETITVKKLKSLRKVVKDKRKYGKLLK